MRKFFYKIKSLKALIDPHSRVSGWFKQKLSVVLARVKESLFSYKTTSFAGDLKGSKIRPSVSCKYLSQYLTPILKLSLRSTNYTGNSLSSLVFSLPFTKVRSLLSHSLFFSPGHDIFVLSVQNETCDNVNIVIDT